MMKPRLTFIAPASRDGRVILTTFIRQCVDAGLDETAAFQGLSKEFEEALSKDISTSDAIMMIKRYYLIDN